jgi:hypothetical protein
METKNPVRYANRVFKTIRRRRLAMSAFGCFKRVDFLCVPRSRLGNMGGQIAVARFPFGRRFGTGAAEPTGRKFNFTAAAVTRFHGFMTDTAIVRAAIGGHERTFLIFANGCTKQGYHLLRDILKKKAGSCFTRPNLSLFQNRRNINNPICLVKTFLTFSGSECFRHSQNIL